MEKETIPANKNNVRFLGRTYNDGINDVTYFNWTCSGLEFEFTGTKAEAEFITLQDSVNDVNSQAWIAVFVNDSDTPVKRFALDKPISWYTLFETEKAGTFRIKVIKLSEVQNGRSGVTRLRVEGEQKIVPTQEKQRKIEFIGDSITCGYANEAEKPEDGFKTYQENGWEAYAAKTARKLDADFNCVSFSGIGIYSSYTPEDKINEWILMPELYNYTDKMLEMGQNKSKFADWDFGSFSPDIIVINLGTNDESYVKYADERQKVFRGLYIDFLKQVREKNGSRPKILCTLGSMDLTLFEEIVSATEEHRARTGDNRIDTMQFDLQDPADGIGGDGHPTIATHEKMSIKLTQKIMEFMGW